jgi:rhamnose transport system ATP-binding protein
VTSAQIDEARGAARSGPPDTIEFLGVEKHFPGVQALAGVSFDVTRGSVHALVGENGSGKSTLIRVLTGIVDPDAGGVRVFGEELPSGKPDAAKAAGVAAVHQELSLIPTLSAEENVCMADLPRRRGFVDARAVRRDYTSLAERLGLGAAPETRAGDLSLADQSLLEIMSALRADARIIVLDEASAALGLDDRKRLHGIVRSLRDEGRTIIFISHDLEEVMEVADAVTVLRDGRHVRSGPSHDWDKRRLVRAMLGDAVAEVVLKPQGERKAERPGGATARVGEPLLDVRALAVPGAVRHASLTLAPGEILGIGGLMGSGRTSLLRALAGAAAGAQGTIRIDGVERRVPRTVREAVGIGIALLPENRRTEGLVLTMSALQNATLSDLRPVVSAGFVRQGDDRRRGQALLSQLRFAGNPAAPATTLSGGNQQKVLLAKWLNRQPRVFLIDEPYRGIDIGARREVLAAIRSLVQSGSGVILVSSEFEDIEEAATRVVLMVDGTTVGELTGDGVAADAIVQGLFEAKER